MPSAYCLPWALPTDREVWGSLCGGWGATDRKIKMEWSESFKYTVQKRNTQIAIIKSTLFTRITLKALCARLLAYTFLFWYIWCTNLAAWDHPCWGGSWSHCGAVASAPVSPAVWRWPPSGPRCPQTVGSAAPPGHVMPAPRSLHWSKMIGLDRR